MNNLRKKIRFKQWLLLFTLIAGLMAVIGIKLSLSFQSGHQSGNTSQKQLVNPMDQSDLMDSLVVRMQRFFREQSSNQTKIRDQLKKLESKTTLSSKEMELLRQSLNATETDVEKLATNYQKTMQAKKNSTLFSSLQKMKTLNAVETVKINEFSLSLKSKNNQRRSVRTPSSYVPVGTFVKAILLSGLEAATSVTGQANPQPVVLRILNNGRLPNHYKTRLKGCILIGAGIGDISSERAFMRLEYLSCVNSKQEVIDFPVYGSVIGPDGRNGVRGRLIWRDKKLLKQSFTAGALAGLGQGLNQSDVTTSVSPLGVTQALNGSQLFKHGVISGASGALDRIAQHYLKKADQLQPVIEVNAGTVVDVIFLKKGFYLNGQNAKVEKRV